MINKRNFQRRLSQAILFPAALVITAQSNASCGSSNCFVVTGSQHGLVAPGQVVLDLSYRYLPQDKKKKGTSGTSEVLTPEVNFEHGEIELDHHKEISTLNSLGQLDLTFGVSSRLSVAVALPFLNDRRHEHEDLEEGEEEEGAEVEEGEFVFNNTDGTSGIGDLSVTAKYAFVTTTRHLLAGGFGIKLPTGEYELLNSDGEINEPSLMPGTGSVDYLFSGFYSYQWQPRKFDSYLSASYRLTTENDLDYEFGNDLTLTVGSNYRANERVTLSTQLNARQVERDRFIGEGVPSTGNTMVYLTPGVQLNSTEKTGFYFHLQLPVYQDVNEVSLVSRYGLQLGISHSI